ncbi:MAG: WYL domain-containing protein [Lachnospiraceae bacterium]|nr:WYL domain-containing protein [Lachnospiraceae bacterium]
MLGNSFTFYNDMPDMLEEILGGEVVHHTRGGARLSEQLNTTTQLGSMTQLAFEYESWDYVVLQEISNGPIRSEKTFFRNIERLCKKIRSCGAKPVLFATWAYRDGSTRLSKMGMSYEQMTEALAAAYHKAGADNDALVADVGRRFLEYQKRLNAEKEQDSGRTSQAPVEGSKSLLDQIREQGLYCEDDLHPTPAASRLAAETIADVIKADLRTIMPDRIWDREGVSDVSRSDTRLRPLYLYRILMQHTDENHPLSTRQIQTIMEQEYGIHMHRTTVPIDVDLLRAAGFAINSRRSRVNKYYLESRQFETAELKILIDVVESSRFITEKKSRILAAKLISLTSQDNADQLKRHLHTSGRVKSANEKGYYIVDAINEAINKKRRIKFYYTDYDARKRQVLRHDGKPYLVSPYTLIWNGDYYYMVGFDHERGEARTYRVDRIPAQPVVQKEEASPPPADFDVARYTREVFRMYDNQEVREVTLVCSNSVMKGVIDKFGLDIPVRKVDDDHFRTRVTVCTSPTFFSWVFQWCGEIRITAPEDAAAEYLEMCRKAMSGYDEDK